jgi:PAS domain S-box-containing protein
MLDNRQSSLIASSNSIGRNKPGLAPPKRTFALTVGIPENEHARLEKLRSYAILDTAPEPAFDRLTQLAATICGTPVAFINFVESDSQWSKSAFAAIQKEVPRDVSFCAHTILQSDLFVIRDALTDPKFASNPMVASSPQIRFYAGVPLITADGHAIGTLCVLDHVARDLTDQQREALRALGSEVISQLDLRKAKADLREAENSANLAIEALRASEEFKSRLIACSRDCVKVLDLEGRLLFLNEGGMQALEICDLAPVLGNFWLDFWSGVDRKSAETALEAARRGETGRFTGYFETRITHQPRWWDVIVSPILNQASKPERILAVSRDVTAQKISDDALHEALNFNRAIIQDAGEGIVVFDGELRYKVFNPFMERLTGKSAAEVLGKVAPEVFPRLRASGIEELLKRALAGEIVKASDILVPKHSARGRDVWESFTLAPQYDAEGKIVGAVAMVSDTTERHLAEEKLQAALQQVQSLQKKLEAENVYLQEEIRKEHNFEEIIGNSPALLDVLKKVETVAPTDSTVLVLGETGCGKELIARAIHNRSKRKSRPLVKVNCGAIPAGLVESELFGHMKGAFTGALERRIGRFELADSGTLFLDEISELPLDTQVKLLRVLQEHEFEPLGSSRTVRVNVRIIAASNRELEKAILEGRFRADLYYRLNVLPMTLPALRQRRTDIPLLTTFFVDRFNRQFGKRITGVAQDTMDLLCAYSWPGNIRELQNVIERAVVLCAGSVLKLGSDLLPVSSPVAEEQLAESPGNGNGRSQSASLDSIERAHILQVLTETKGVIEGPRGAAKILGLHPNTLRSRMKKLGVERPSTPA